MRKIKAGFHFRNQSFANRRILAILRTIETRQQSNHANQRAQKRVFQQPEHRRLYHFNWNGTRGRTRTGKPVTAGDFESPVSTNSTTRAERRSLAQ